MDELQKLHGVLTKKNLYTKSLEDFKTQFSNPESQGKLYQAVSEQGLYTKSQEDFTNQFFTDPVKKKVQTEPGKEGSKSPSQDTTSASQKTNRKKYRLPSEDELEAVNPDFKGTTTEFDGLIKPNVQKISSGKNYAKEMVTFAKEDAKGDLIEAEDDAAVVGVDSGKKRMLQYINSQREAGVVGFDNPAGLADMYVDNIYKDVANSTPSTEIEKDPNENYPQYAETAYEDLSVSRIFKAEDVEGVKDTQDFRNFLVESGWAAKVDAEYESFGYVEKIRDAENDTQAEGIRYQMLEDYYVSRRNKAYRDTRIYNARLKKGVGTTEENQTAFDEAAKRVNGFNKGIINQLGKFENLKARTEKFKAKEKEYSEYLKGDDFKLGMEMEYYGSKAWNGVSKIILGTAGSVLDLIGDTGELGAKGLGIESDGFNFFHRTADDTNTAFDFLSVDMPELQRGVLSYSEVEHNGKKFQVDGGVIYVDGIRVLEDELTGEDRVEILKKGKVSTSSQMDVSGRAITGGVIDMATQLYMMVRTAKALPVKNYTQAAGIAGVLQTHHDTYTHIRKELELALRRGEIDVPQKDIQELAKLNTYLNDIVVYSTGLFSPNKPLAGIKTDKVKGFIKDLYAKETGNLTKRKVSDFLGISLRESLKEVVQEETELIMSKQINALTNVMLNSDVLDTQVSKAELAETALVTFLGTGLTTGGSKASNFIGDVNVYDLKKTLSVGDSETTNKAVQRAIQEGEISEGFGKKLAQEILDIKQNDHLIPDNISSERRAAIIPLLKEKAELTREAKAKDNSFKEQYDNKIAEVENKIHNAVLGKPIPRALTTQEASELSDYKKTLTEIGLPKNMIDAISDDISLEVIDIQEEGRIDGAGYYEYNSTNLTEKERVVVDAKYQGSDYFSELVTHEAVHSATAIALNKLVGGDGVSTDKFTVEQKDAAEDLKKVASEYRKSLSEKDQSKRDLYGITNTKEFVAEFIANPTFRKFVEENASTTGSRIWEGILNMLGIKGPARKRIQKIEDNIDLIFEAQKSVRAQIKEELNIKGNSIDKSPNLDTKTELMSNPAPELDPANKTFKNEIKKILTGVPVISYIDDKVFNNLADKIDTAIAKKVQAGQEHQNVVVRRTSKIATNWFNGLTRTQEELADRRRLTGQQEIAYVEGSKMTKSLQEIIGFDVEAARRVHAVLDPEMYEGEAEELLTFEELTDSEQKLFNQIREINNMTHETNFKEGFIDEKTYEKYKDNYIGRGYEVHEDLANTEEKEILLSNKIMGDIYKKRKDIDQWKIDNKVTDPIYLTVNRMIRTQRNVAVKRYTEAIETKASEEPKKGYSQLNGKAYGNLDGKYVPNYLAEDFKGYFFLNSFMDSMYEGVKAYDKTIARQFLKRFHTVYSPVVQIGNFMSNHAFAFASGINAPLLWSQLPGARQDIKNQEGDYLTLVENGILGANILTPDLALTSEAQNALKLKGKKSVAARWVKGADDFARNLYAGSDDIMKLSAYKALRATGYTEAQAIERVFQGFQNYATVGKVWDFASKTPIFGNAYIKFQADLMRIVKNGVMRRPLTTATFLSGVKLMALIASELSGEDEEEREIREARPFIPKIKLGFTDIPLVMKFGEKEVNLARYVSPYYDYDVPGKHWLEKATKFTPFQLDVTEASEMGQTSTSIASPDVLLGSVWSAFMENRDFRQKSISDPYATRYKESGLTEWEKFVNRSEYVGRSVVPLGATAQDLYLSSMYGEDFYGRNKTIPDIMLSKFVKIQTFDDASLKKTIEQSMTSIKREHKTITTKISSIKKAYQKEVMRLSTALQNDKITQEQYTNGENAARESSLERINVQMLLLTKQQEKMNQLVQRVEGINLSED